MKYVLIYTFLLMSVFHTSCGQNQTYAPPDIIKSETYNTPHFRDQKASVLS